MVPQVAGKEVGSAAEKAIIELEQGRRGDVCGNERRKE